MGKDKTESKNRDIKDIIEETRKQIKGLDRGVAETMTELMSYENSDDKTVTISREKMIGMLRELLFLKKAFASFGTMISDRADECRKELKKKEKKKED